MSHYYAQQHQNHQARPRPEPLALGGQQHAPPALDQHRARLLSSLRSAPLPNQYHHQYNHNQNHNMHQAQGQYHNPAAAFAPAAAEFQQAQSAYLAELAGLQRTIEQQIVAQQQLERDAAYRLLAAQRQGQGQAPQFANYAPAPHQQQQHQHQHQHQHQGPYSAGPHAAAGGRGFAQQQQQFAPAPTSGAHEAQNPLVASALARRQRQEQAQYAPQQQQRSRGGSSSPHGRGPAAPRPGAQSQSQPQSRSASREHRSTPPLYGQQQQPRASPPPPALILSAPGQPYPDTSSSGSESGETRPSSPDASLDVAKRHEQQQQQQQGVKAARRRSHLDALVGLGHAVEQRKGGAGVAVASRARPASSSFAPPPSQGEFYVPGSAPAHAYGHRSVSDSYAVLSPHASTYAPSPAPSPAPVPRYAPPPVPGTAYAVRQPRGPPTDLSEATNFSSRMRARAIESLRASGGRRCSSGSGSGVGEVEGVLVPSLATVHVGA
ncbi:hypothetical protein JCM3775_000035 [Rhodotorula graminis]